jgi:hypothetical protein
LPLFEGARGTIAERWGTLPAGVFLPGPPQPCPRSDMKEKATGLEADRIRKERESFIVLQHLYTLADADPKHAVQCSRIAADLGFHRTGCGPLVEHLISVGCLAWATPGHEVSITPMGVDYIERLAWRRRTVRAPPL